MQVDKTYKVVSTTPLLMHNERLANPLDKLAKQLKEYSGKRKKTDDDLLMMSEIEFKGGLYLNEDGQLVIPTRVWEGVIINGAKKNRKGATFKSAVFVAEDSVLDIGKKLAKTPDATAEKLWKDGSHTDVRGVRVQTSKIMRTRPIFREWKTEVTFTYDNSQINESDLDTAMELGGTLVGVGDYRPKYGKYRLI